MYKVILKVKVVLSLPALANQSPYSYQCFQSADPVAEKFENFTDEGLRRKKTEKLLGQSMACVTELGVGYS